MTKKTTSDTSERADNLVKWLVGLVFLGLAGIFYFSCPRLDIPLSQGEPVTPDQINPAPLRELLGDPPVAVVNYYERSCQDCHQIFESPEVPFSTLFQHTEIVFDHGINEGCFNCHHREDRNMLVLRTGEKVPFTQVERLCMQCHGTTYRDWQKGMHGKTLGYWDASKGESRRLRCSECHDPHAPAFDSFTPLPGPGTLRMGKEPEGDHSNDAEKNPLRTWSRDSVTGEEH